MENPSAAARSGSVRRSEHRFFDRAVALSDGVAAIAITLLVLPLVELEPPDLAHGETVWDALATYQNQLLAFAITFVVIASLWFGHARVFAILERADGLIAWVNIAYLLAIVVLPFASAWLQEDGFAGGVGTFYYLVLALASGSLGVISRHALAHPELLTAEAQADPGPRARRGYQFTVFFLVGAVISWFWADLAGWYMLALWPYGLLLGRIRRD